jgi:CheY-like chemotaxis protein
MKEKILIALSDSSLSSLIDKKFKDKGYQTYQAKNGKEALDKMKLLRPDLVLIDTNLTLLNGYEVLNKKSFDREITKIPVIIVSNSGNPLQMREIPSTPTIRDFIVKSHIEPDEVIEKAEKVLGKSPASSAKSGKGTAGKKVLWVEDDKLLSTILSKKFESTGYNLLKASNGDEALKLIESNTPDIIILDIVLPGISGFEILQKIKMNEALRKIPVIMLSNLSKQSDIDKAKVLGANRFIVKAAVSLDEIIREVENLLRK